MAKKHITSIKILDMNLWNQLKHESKENHEPISVTLFRMLYYYRKWEEYQKNEPTFEEVIKVFPLKNAKKLQ